MDILIHAVGTEAEGVAWTWPPLKKKFNFLIIDNTEMNCRSYLKFLEWTINMIYKQNLLAPSHTKIVGHICLYSIGVENCLLFSFSFHQSLLGGAGHQYWGNQEGEWGRCVWWHRCRPSSNSSKTNCAKKVKLPFCSIIWTNCFKYAKKCWMFS